MCSSKQMHVYLDESGDLDTPFIGVAGFIATPERWTTFAAKWQASLEEYGASYFHMQEVEQGKKQFAGWSREKRESLVNALIVVIQESVIYSVASAVAVDDYNEVMPAVFRNDRKSPWSMCLTDCLQAVSIQCHKGHYHDTIAFVLDKKKGLQGKAVEIQNHLDDLPLIQCGEQFETLTFADDKLVSPLQAADLWAYEFTKQLRYGKDRQYFKSLMKVEGLFKLWNRDQLIGFREHLVRRGALSDSEVQASSSSPATT